MNLILLSPEDWIAAGRVRLSGRRLRHVLEVHRGAAGDELRVGAIGGRTGRGRIASLSAAAMEIDVELSEDPPAPLPLILLLALPRPKTLRKVLQAATAMGVKSIFLMASWRVEKSFWQSPVVRPEGLLEQVMLGLEQAGDTMPPQVEMRRRFKPFVEDEVPALIAGSRALVAHPAAPSECPRHIGGPVTLAVGPEGGFIPYEIEMLGAAGFEAVSLGPRRLRVEHAVPALLGRLF